MNTENAYFYRINENAIAPQKMTGLSSGFDIYLLEDVILKPNKITIINTGLIIKPPKDCFYCVFIRSSIALKYGVWLANSVAVIDEDYCGSDDELKLIVYRAPLNDRPILLEKGTRIAQIVFFNLSSGVTDFA